MTPESESTHPCPACGELSAQGARYCSSCGALLSSVAEADRRVITVLFADLRGFTPLTERLDPEDVRALVSGCLDPVCDAVAEWGGYVDKFIGDCVMALFGAPVAYENEPERAVRAAIDMQEAMDDLRLPVVERVATETGYRPLLRVGVATGTVVTGVFSGGGARNYTAVGDAVNVASRIQGLCDPGAILVDDATYKATRHLFEFGDEHVLKVKGRVEAVRTHYVRGARAERGAARGLEGKKTPFVGRGTEIAALRSQWVRKSAGGFEVTAVIGPAGIGKSRLIQELVGAEGLGASRVARGRSYPYASRSPWEPLAELLREIHGIDSGLPAGEAAAVMAAAGAAGTDDEGDALSVVLGLPAAENAPISALRPEERTAHIQEVIARHLAGRSGDRRLLILEDLHWADHATLGFLEQLAAQPPTGSNVLLLISRPPLPGEDALSRLIDSCPDVLMLPPLSTEASRELLDRLLEPHELPEQLLLRIADRCDGNPLFLEEICRSLFEDGTLTRVGETVISVGDPSLVQVPDSVESLLSTRIDGLNAESKRVLQYAAIVGRQFWAGVLSDALAGRPVDDELTALENGAVVRKQPLSLVEGDREYVFEHLLMQEVAYEGLLRGMRAELHAAVAEWLDDNLSGELGEHHDRIAFHFERSDDPPRAVPYLVKAALAARDGGALDDARKLLTRAISLTTETGQEAQLLTIMEEIAASRGDIQERYECITRLEDLAEESGDPELLAHVSYRRAHLSLDGGDLSGARELGEEALERYRDLGDVSLEGDAHRLLGRVEHLWGRYPEAEQHYERGLACEREAGDESGQADMYDRLGLVRIDEGDFVEGLTSMERGREMFAALGQRAQEARVLAHMATARRWMGALDEAEENAREAMDLAQRAGSRRAQSSVEVTLGMIEAAIGREGAEERLRNAATLGREIGNRSIQARAWLALSDLEEDPVDAEAHVRRVLKLCQGSGLVHLQIMALTGLAEHALRSGRLDEADSASADALEKLRLHGNVQGPEERVLTARAEVLAALGRAAERASLIEEAAQVVRSKAERIPDEGDRSRFLELPPNPRILEAAGAIGAESEP